MKRKPKIYDCDGKRLRIGDFVDDALLGIVRIHSKDPASRHYGNILVLEIKRKNGLFHRYGFNKTKVNDKIGYHVSFFKKHEKKT